MPISGKVKEMKDEFSTADRKGLSDMFGASTKQTLSVDVQKYQDLLDGSGLTDEQKQQVLEALWSLIMNFVELGFEVHPLQEVCGQDDAEDTEHAKDAFDAVNFEHPEPE